MEGGDTGEDSNLTKVTHNNAESVARPKSASESTLTEVEKLREELSRIKSENLRLDGKLRGYSTLNQLFQESKDHCLHLQTENQKLRHEFEKRGSARKKIPIQNGTEQSTVKVEASGSINETPAETQGNSSERVKSLSSQPQTVGQRNEPEGEQLPSQLSAEGQPARQLSADVTTDSDVADPDDLDKLSETRSAGGASGFVIPSSSQFVSTVNSAQLYGLGSLHHLSSTEDSYSGPSISIHTPHSPNVSSQRTRVLASRPLAEASLDEMRGGSPLSIHVAADLNKMAAKTAQLERSERQWKAFAGTLQAEVQKIKKGTQDQGETISQLKTENLMLLQKIKKFEHERDLLSPGDSLQHEGSTAGAGWVHVTKQQASSPGLTEDTSILISLQQKLQTLKLNNSQLQEANKRWELYRYQTETTYEGKIAELQSKVESSERALAAYRKQDEKRQSEFDKLLLLAKRRGDQLESEKEDLLDQLHQRNNQIQALECRLQQLQQQNQILQSSHAVTPTAPVSSSVFNLEASENQPTRSQFDEIVNEKEALKQQLTIFKEDFDKEREDRAKAQSEKDSLQRNTTDLTKQLKRAQAQQKSAEDSLRNSLSQNEQFHQQVTSLRRQLKSSEESLRRCLEESDQLRSQLHRLKHQQPHRLNVVSPPPGGQPFYPPTPQPLRTPQSPRWPEQQSVYQTAQPTETGPELLPGLWQCPSCTYVNYPRRTVCEMCGAFNNQHQWEYMPGTEQPTSPQGAYHWSTLATDTHTDPRNLVPRGLESTNLVTDGGPS